MKFRFGMSTINIHQHRYRNDVLLRHLVCPMCSSREIEDEDHVLFDCVAYADLRVGIPALENRHPDGCTMIFSVDFDEFMLSIARYLYHCLRRRELLAT